MSNQRLVAFWIAGRMAVSNKTRSQARNTGTPVHSCWGFSYASQLVSARLMMQLEVPVLGNSRR